MRLLILAQRFYPARSVAAVPWTAFADELAELGDEVAVICNREPGDGAGSDPRAIFEVLRQRRNATALATRPATPTERAPLGRTARLKYLISEMAVPDVASLAWFRRRRAILAAAEAFRPDVVVSVSPPHGLHLFGRWLTRRLGVPWIADFRDPYVGDVRYDRPDRLPWRQANRRMEASFIRGADAVLVAGEVHHRDLRERFPDVDRIVHVPNGFHPAATADRSVGQLSDDVVELVVVGTAGVDELLTVARGAARLHPEQPLRLRTIGLSESQVAPLREVIEVIDHPWIDADQMPPLLERASCLLLVLNAARERVGGTSTKLYQYLDAGRPVLAVNPCAADVLLLDRWAQHRVIREPDVAEAEEALRALLVARPVAVDLDDFRRAYSWPAIAARLRPVLADVGKDASGRGT